MAKKKQLKRKKLYTVFFDEGGPIIIKQVHAPVMDSVSYTPENDPNLTAVSSPKPDNNVGNYPAVNMDGSFTLKTPSRIGDSFELAAKLLEGKPKDIRKIIGLNNAYAVGGSLTDKADAIGYVGESIVKGINNAKIPDTSNVKSEIKTFGNTKLDASTNDELMSLYDTNRQLNHIRAKDLKGGNFGTDLLHSFGSSATGVQKGMAFGPVGGVVGGIVGGVSSLVGSLIGRGKARREAKRINRLVDYANLNRASSLSNIAENIEDTRDLTLQSSYMAYGGPINMKYSGIMSPFGNQFKDGGIYIKPSKRGTFTKAAKERGLEVQEFASKVLTNPEDYTESMRKKVQFAKNASKWHSLGGPLFNDFTNGVTIIGNGDSHENNPFKGVQIGVDPQGVPNLVEEGEVIFNDYVFSNRLKVPKAIRNKYKLRGNKDLTFADAAKQMQKESEERPNDPISKRGLEDNMMKLMTIQEQIRQKEEDNKYAKGGNLFYNGSKLNPYKNFTVLPEDTDFYDQDYLAFWDWMNANRTDQKAIDWLNRINSREFGDIGGNTFNFDDILRLAKDRKKGPVHNAFYKASRAFNKNKSTDGLNNIPITVKFKAEDFNSPTIQTEFDYSEFDNPEPFVAPSEPIAPINMHPLRYSSTVGQFASVLNNLLGGNDPDYGNLATFEGASRNIRPVKYTPIGNYLMYKPFDRNYYQNMLTASSNATRRATRNVSGGNRAQALAGILAADYNEGMKLGELSRQAEEYNLARRQQVEDFNRATNMFNSELGFKAGATNAELDARRAALLGEVARMRELERMSNRKEKIDANTAFLTSLDNIGKEKTYLDMLRWMEETGVLESKKGYGKTKGKTTKR